MGTPSIVRYRLPAWVRWGVPPMVFATLVALGVGFRMTPIGQTQAGPPIVVTLLVDAVLAAVVSVVLQRPAVTLAPDALIIRSVFRSASFPWSQVSAVAVDGRNVWVTAPSGCHVLPFDRGRPAVVADGATPPLAEAVMQWWVAFRGRDWTPQPLAPWQPRRDLKGRAVLRPTFLIRLQWLSGTLGLCTAYLLLRSEVWVVGLVLLAVDAIVVVAYHWWSRVTISADLVTARSLVAGRTRVLRAAVTGVVEVPYGRPRSGPGAATGLALVVGNELVALPAPLRHANRFDSDPAFFRTWTWLYDELVPVHPFPPGEAVDRFDRVDRSPDIG